MMIFCKRLVRFSSLFLVLLSGVTVTLSGQCYLPFSRPLCLLDTEKSLKEVIEEHEYYHLQRSGPQKDQRQFSYQSGRQNDLLLDPRIGGILDSFYNMSVRTLEQELGSSYLCDHVSLDVGNFRINKQHQDEAFVGKFTFQIYPSGKSCWDTKFRSVSFEFKIPLKAMVTWKPLFETIDTSYLKPKKISDQYELHVPAIVALREQGYLQKLGRYVLIEDEGEVAGFRDFSSPFITRNVLLDSSKLKSNQGQFRNRPRYPLTMSKKGIMVFDSTAVIVDATPVRMDVFRSSHNEIDKYFTFKVHSAMGIGTVDSTVSVVQRNYDNGTSTSHGPTPIYIGNRSLGVLAPVKEEHMEHYATTHLKSGHQSLYSFGSWHNSLYHDLYEAALDSLQQQYPAVKVTTFPRQVCSAVEDSVRAQSLGLMNTGPLMVHHASENRVVLSEPDTIFELNYGAFSTDLQTRLIAHQVTFAYDTTHFGADLVSSNRIHLHTSDYSVNDEEVMVTQLASAYDYTVKDVASNMFQVTITASRMHDLHVLLNEFSWSRTDAPVYLVHADIDLDISGELPDSLLWVVENPTPFQSTYMSPTGEVKPFATVVELNDVVKDRRRWKNYYKEEAFKPLIDSLSSYEVRAGDTLTIWGKHLEAKQKIYVTGSKTVDEYTYRRFFEIPSRNIISESPEKIKIIVPHSGKSIHSDLGDVSLCAGYLKVGFRGFSPEPLSLE